MHFKPFLVMLFNFAFLFASDHWNIWKQSYRIWYCFDFYLVFLIPWFLAGAMVPGHWNCTFCSKKGNNLEKWRDIEIEISSGRTKYKMMIGFTCSISEILLMRQIWWYDPRTVYLHDPESWPKILFPLCYITINEISKNNKKISKKNISTRKYS